MFWMVTAMIGALGLVWLKIRRRRKAATDAPNS